MGSAIRCAIACSAAFGPARAQEVPGAPPATEERREDALVDELLEDLAASSARAAEVISTEIDHRRGDVSRFLVGNVRFRFEPGKHVVTVACDRLVIHAEGLLRRLRAGGPADGPLAFYFYADGNVRIEVPTLATVIRAESLYYDHRLPLAIIQDARLLTTVDGVEGLESMVALGDPAMVPPLELDPRERTVPLAVSAAVLRTSDFRRFSGDGLRITTCDFGEPHYAVALDRAHVEPVEPDVEGDLPAGRRHFKVAAERPRLEVWGTPVLPLPLEEWDTRWQEFLPIRSLDAGTSSKFGAHGSVEWNLNFFLESLPLESVPPVERWLRSAKLGLETVYLDKRGFGYGPLGEYGKDPDGWEPWQLRLGGWTYYGEGRYFRIRDHGEDRSGGGGEPPDPDRYWSRIVHRQALPWIGTVDIEHSKFSDPNFLNEYFEPIFEEEKEQENVVALRRNFRDNLALTGLVKYRLNDFETVVERLPEARFLALEEPVLDTGLYSSLSAEAANLRVRPAASSGLATERFGRVDVLNEWAYPASWVYPYLQVRPFALARYTGYEDTAGPGGGAEDRGAFGAGVALSQEWWRSFLTPPGAWLHEGFGIDGLTHVVIPSVRYENVFANDLDPAETIQVDAADRVAEREVVEVSLRQGLVAKRRVRPEGEEAARVRPLLGLKDVWLEPSAWKRWQLLESEVSFQVFPRAGRDNRGDSLSRLVLDNTLWLSESLSLRSWIGLDPNEDFRFDLAQSSARAELWPGYLDLTVGNAFARAPRGEGDDSNFLFALVSVYPDERWRAQLFWSRDLESGEESEVSFVVGRIFHRFALLFEYSFDAGEGDDHRFLVNFRPLDFFGGAFRRGSRW